MAQPLGGLAKGQHPAQGQMGRKFPFSGRKPSMVRNGRPR